MMPFTWGRTSATRRGGATGELGHELQRGGMKGDHVHGGGRHLHGLLGFSLVTTACQQATCQQGKADQNDARICLCMKSLSLCFNKIKNDKTTGFIRCLLVKWRR